MFGGVGGWGVGGVESGTVSKAHTTTTTTTRSTRYTPSSKTEHIPHSPSCIKDTHLPRSQIPDEFFGGVWAPGFGDPPPSRWWTSPESVAKNTTNDGGSWETLSQLSGL